MKHAIRPEMENPASPLTGTFAGPQAFPTIIVPDHVERGWVEIGGEWQKSAALIAAEAAEADDDAERALLKQIIATFKAGTATNAQVQRAIAYLLKRQT